MVTTIDVTQAQYFIPEIWAQAALPILRKNIVAVPRVTQDSDVAAFTVGDVLHIPYPGTLVANDKAAGTAYTLQAPTGEAEVTVTLNKHKEATFVVEDIVRAFANQDVRQRYVEAAAIALAEQVETDLITLLQTATNTDGTSAYGTDLTYATMLKVREAMTTNLCPADGRSMIVHTKDSTKLLGDTALATYFAYSQTAGISEGRLGRIAGFDVFESQVITSVAGTPVTTKDVAFRKDGAIIAFRGLPEPPAGSGAFAANIRDPESGIVLRALTAYRADLGGLQVTLEVLYGVAKLQEAKLMLVKS